MMVRDGMNKIVVTVGPSHTLREAARRMSARNVGTAVVMDNEGQGPGIITERDLLHSSGAGEDFDAELVRDHLSSNLIYAHVDWPLERAAEVMIKRAIRHVIVLGDRSDVLGILSMRDIVRSWTTDAETGEVSAAGGR